MAKFTSFTEKRGRQKNRAYIRFAQKNLLQHMLAPWTRREASMLEINCGEGTFSRMLWKSGFDIIATEPDAALRRKALAKNIDFLEMRACHSDDLPFEENRFDWVVLHIGGYEKNLLGESIREAMRVGKKGLVMTFWNSFSLAGLMRHFRRGEMEMPFGNAVSWRKIWKLAKNAGDGRFFLRTTLGAPISAWNFGCPFSFFNEKLSFLTFGAWAVLRIDFGVLRPLTPLPLKVFNPLSSPQAIMEYQQEN